MKKLFWAACVLITLVVATAAGFYARPIGYFRELNYFQERMAGMESQTTTVEGIRLHYNVVGPSNGPVVVLVHGLGGRAEDWRNLAPFLAHAGYRVYMPDLPGYGRSQQPADFSYSVPDQAQVVVGFFDALGLKQVDLGGWSMGGWIVQCIASEHPERVRKLMLFDSAGLYVKPDWDTRLFTPGSLADLDQLDALLMPHPPVVPVFIGRDILRLSDKNAWVVQRALASMLTGKDATDNLLPGLKMPVLLVWGADDKITPLTQGETMHKLIPQSQLVVIPGCGHLAPDQCAIEMGDQVVAFVKQ